MASKVVVVATTKVGIFKQITTHSAPPLLSVLVVVATTKVGIFKQITTKRKVTPSGLGLLLLPQR